jgi:hypothetical protein
MLLLPVWWQRESKKAVTKKKVKRVQRVVESLSFSQGEGSGDESDVDRECLRCGGDAIHVDLMCARPGSSVCAKCCGGVGKCGRKKCKRALPPPPSL